MVGQHQPAEEMEKDLTDQVEVNIPQDMDALEDPEEQRGEGKPPASERDFLQKRADNIRRTAGDSPGQELEDVREALKVSQLAQLSHIQLTCGGMSTGPTHSIGETICACMSARELNARIVWPFSSGH